MPKGLNKFRIKMMPDKMSAVMYPVDLSEPGCMSIEEVREEFEKQGIIFGIDFPAIEQLIASENPDETVVARGKRPKDGKDGFVKFLIDASAKPQFIPDDGHAIDYKQAMRVSLTTEGMQIAEVIPPTQGESGSNLVGATLTPIAGAAARPKLGEGVEQKGNGIFSMVAGMPSSRNDIITVKRIYELKGDVDYASGNINFPGTVIIHGNVLDGFEVNSDENVLVKGSILGAKINAKGNLKCMGGILGKGLAQIRVGGHVEVKFCDSATIISEGDIMVTKDSMQCRLQTMGLIQCGGSFIGGEALSLMGLHCKNLGSNMGAKTLVGLRKHYRQEKAKELSDEVLSEGNRILERYKRWLAIPDLNDQEEAIANDMRTVQGLIQKKKTLDLQIEKFEKVIQETKGVSIHVQGVLYADVIMTSPLCRHSTVDSIRGPLTILENVNAGIMSISHG